MSARVVVAVLALLASSAHAEIAQLRQPPTPAEFRAIAGEHGFIVGVSPDTWSDVLSRLEQAKALEAEHAALLSLHEAEGRVIEAATDEIARLKARDVEQEARIARLSDDIERAEKAVLDIPKCHGGWWFAGGLAVGFAAPLAIEAALE